ncbi:CHAD domain-containing protein [Amorphus sp. 3PC139-8]
MAYRFSRTDGSVAEAVRRVAGEQIDKAIAEIDDQRGDRHETVHDVRKRCKKLRGLVRLVRPGFPAYAEENAAYRDIGRLLSPLRDTGAMIEAYDDLTAAYDDQIERPAFASIRRRLTLRRKEVSRRDIDERLAEVRDLLVDGKVRALRWAFDTKGAAPVWQGLAKTYGRGRDAMATARKSPTEEALHDWRKRVKYHGYHTRLLSPIWPEPMSAHQSAASALGDLLGDHHDLDVLEATLKAEPDAFGHSDDLAVFLALLDRRRGELRADAFALGDRLFAEKSKVFSARWRAYWKVWRAETKASQVALAA